MNTLTAQTNYILMGISKDQLAEDHIGRINKALMFIDKNLDELLTLQVVSAAAHYSPYHFHRIFKTVTGQTLNSYITRKRIEKTASVLMRNKEVTIAELSLQYSFKSNSSFTRAFKNFYGISPTTFRAHCKNKYSKISKTESKNGQKKVVFESEICNMENQHTTINVNAKVIEMPALQLAYLSHLGDGDRTPVFEKLIRWSKSKGLATNEPELLTIYHDSFKITSPDKVRTSAGMILNQPVNADGDVSLTTIEKGKFAVGHFTINRSEFGTAWSNMYKWVNENGYQATDRACFEIYRNDYRLHPEKKFILDLYVPIN